jgi:hypothetical protein
VTLYYGILASGSNTMLVWAKNQSEFVKFIVAYFACDRFGGKWRIYKEIPKYVGKI